MKTRRTVLPNAKKKPRTKTRKRTFLYNATKPTFNVYTNDDPTNTVHIKFTTVQDVQDTIRNLEHLYKAESYTHKRIWQVGMILNVRLHVLRKKKPDHYKLSNRYVAFLKHRTSLSEEERRKAVFVVS